jgi:hypothetical protein
MRCIRILVLILIGLCLIKARKKKEDKPKDLIKFKKVYDKECS